MDEPWKTALWQQFGASIDMLENAITTCPETVWGERFAFNEFWYIAHHTLFWLDVYLSDGLEGFTPPAPFGLSELDPEGAFPNRVYTREDLLTYLAHSRRKAQMKVEALTDEKAQQRCTFGSLELSVLEIFLYNMRHVQHHVAQLNLILRQQTDTAPGWVAKAKVTG